MPLAVLPLFVAVGPVDGVDVPDVGIDGDDEAPPGSILESVQTFFGLLRVYRGCQHRPTEVVRYAEVSPLVGQDINVERSARLALPNYRCLVG